MKKNFLQIGLIVINCVSLQILAMETTTTTTLPKNLKIEAVLAIGQGEISYSMTYATVEKREKTGNKYKIEPCIPYSVLSATIIDTDTKEITDAATLFDNVLKPLLPAKMVYNFKYQEPDFITKTQLHCGLYDGQYQGVSFTKKNRCIKHLATFRKVTCNGQHEFLPITIQYVAHPGQPTTSLNELLTEMIATFVENATINDDCHFTALLLETAEKQEILCISRDDQGYVTEMKHGRNGAFKKHLTKLTKGNTITSTLRNRELTGKFPAKTRQ